MTQSILNFPLDALVLIAVDVLRQKNGLRFMRTCKVFKNAGDVALKRIYNQILIDNSVGNSNLAKKMRVLHTAASQGKTELPASEYSKLWAQVMLLMRRETIPQRLDLLYPSLFDRINKAYEACDEDAALITMWQFLTKRNENGIDFVSSDAKSCREWLTGNPEKITSIKVFNFDKSDLKLTRLPPEIGKFPLKILKISQPCTFSSLPDNYELWIEGNCLDEIPPEISKEWKRLINGIDGFLNPTPGVPFTRHLSKSILIDDHRSSYSSLIYYCILFSEVKTEGPIKEFILKHLKKQLTQNGRVELERVCKEMDHELPPSQPINGLSKAATRIFQHCLAGNHKSLKRTFLKIAKEDFEGFDPKWKEKVYELIYRFAGSPQTEDKILWGKEHAFEKSFRFLMAFDCVARGMFKLPTPSLL
ncbi:MAG: hypothetical protein HYX67_01660 [Candidatus Melainabacteria bacterium]|nr:hypothetical protein [Candidatus Melainabacteria bacterium]